jgi:diacylglycerol kinase family enzyme
MLQGLNSTPRRVIVLVNPRAGRPKARALPQELVEQLAAAGFLAAIVPDLAQACGDANRLHKAGELRAIVAAGGDGTIAEVVNRTEPGVPITTLPLGTENLLARHFGISCDPTRVAEIVGHGHSVDLDVGRVTNDAGTRLFLLMASAGLDAEIIKRLHDARRGNISHWSYIKPILGAAAAYSYPVIRIVGENRSQDNGHPSANAEQTARWAVAFNMPCYAGMLRFFPQHHVSWGLRGNDGRLDLCRFDGGGFWRTLYYYVWLLFGRADRIGTRHVEQFASLRLEALEPGEKVPLQIDGDPCGYLPAGIDVLKGRLRLIAPPARKDP